MSFSVCAYKRARSSVYYTCTESITDGATKEEASFALNFITLMLKICIMYIPNFQAAICARYKVLNTLNKTTISERVKVKAITTPSSWRSRALAEKSGDECVKRPAPDARVSTALCA